MVPRTSEFSFAQGNMGTGELCCLLAQELVENGALLNALQDSCRHCSWGDRAWDGRQRHLLMEMN